MIKGIDIPLYLIRREESKKVAGRRPKKSKRAFFPLFIGIFRLFILFLLLLSFVVLQPDAFSFLTLCVVFKRKTCKFVVVAGK